jgi:hypothetical protein
MTRNQILAAAQQAAHNGPMGYHMSPRVGTWIVGSFLVLLVVGLFAAAVRSGS